MPLKHGAYLTPPSVPVLQFINTSSLLLPCSAPQGERISPQMWGAVGLGLLGSCLVAFGGISAESSDMAAAYPDELKGVCLLLAASLAISVATIRLGTLGKGEGEGQGGDAVGAVLCLRGKGGLTYCGTAQHERCIPHSPSPPPPLQPRASAPLTWQLSGRSPSASRPWPGSWGSSTKVCGDKATIAH